MATRCNKIPNCPHYDADFAGRVGDSHMTLRCKQFHCDVAPAYNVFESNVRPREIKKSEGKKYDDEKLRFDLIPPEFLKAVATVLTDGLKKYSPNNWKKVPGLTERYTAALMRHLNAWRSGEKLDPESGHPHLWHIACNVAFLIWKEYNETDTSIEELMRDAYRL